MTFTIFYYYELYIISIQFCARIDRHASKDSLVCRIIFWHPNINRNVNLAIFWREIILITFKMADIEKL